MNRRDFFRHAGTAAGTLALNAFPHHLFAAATQKFAADRVKLGPMGVEVSRLAMGTGTNGVGGSSNQTRKLGLRGLAEMLCAAYDQGVTFFDSADQYGTHSHIKEALKGVPREKVQLLTKTRATTARQMREDLDRYRSELGVDYIDIVLLHALTDPDWNRKNRGAMDVLAEAREKKIIRAHGASCHSLAALRTSALEPWLQVQLARINPARVAMDADVPAVVSALERIKAAGKGVIGMKILGVGRLRKRADECLQFALAQSCVDCFTIGSENRAEFEDLTRKIPPASVRG